MKRFRTVLIGLIGLVIISGGSVASDDFYLGGSVYGGLDLTTPDKGYQHDWSFGISMGVKISNFFMVGSWDLKRIGRSDPKRVWGNVFASPINAESGAANFQKHELFGYWKIKSIDFGFGARRWAVVSLLKNGGDTRWGRENEVVLVVDKNSPTIGYADGLSVRLRYHECNFYIEATGLLISIGNHRTLPYSEYELIVSKQIGKLNLRGEFEFPGSGKRPVVGRIIVGIEVIPDFMIVGLWAGSQQRPDWVMSVRNQVGVMLQIHTATKYKI